MPPAARRRVERLAAVLLGLFGVLCAWYGTRLAGSVVNTLPATGWSAAWQYVPAAAGGLLIAVVAVLRARRCRGPAVGDDGARAAR